jgi:hypothetical protein
LIASMVLLRWVSRALRRSYLVEFDRVREDILEGFEGFGLDRFRGGIGILTRLPVFESTLLREVPLPSIFVCN